MSPYESLALNTRQSNLNSMNHKFLLEFKIDAQTRVDLADNSWLIWRMSDNVMKARFREKIKLNFASTVFDESPRCLSRSLFLFSFVHLVVRLFICTDRATTRTVRNVCFAFIRSKPIGSAMGQNKGESG